MHCSRSAKKKSARSKQQDAKEANEEKPNKKYERRVKRVNLSKDFIGDL